MTEKRAAVDVVPEQRHWTHRFRERKARMPINLTPDHRFPLCLQKKHSVDRQGCTLI